MTQVRSGAAYYADIIREKAVRREIVEGAADLATMCLNGHEIGEVVSAATVLYHRAIGVNQQKRCAIPADLLLDYAKEAQRPAHEKVRAFIPALDRMLDGIMPGEVLAIIARPRVGKSAIASQIMLDNARAGHASAFFSLEMPRLQAFSRLAMQALNAPGWEIKRLARENWKTMTAEQTAKLSPVLERIAIIDRGRSGIGDIESGLEEAAAVLNEKIRLVVIDYLGLLCQGSRSRSLYERVSEAAVDVKSFAKMAEVPVVLLVQAGRDQDSDRTEGAGRLGLDAARDSGQIEEAGDFLMTMWRPELASRLSAAERDHLAGRLECALVKNRRGPIGDFSLSFSPSTVTITTQEDQ